MKNVYIIGIGMGNPETLTVGALNIIKNSNRIIGAERMVNAMAKLCENKDLQIAYAIKSNDILKLIEQCHTDSKIVVLMSGDTGFFSGTKKLAALIEEKDDITCEVIPGISSLQYLAAKAKINWDDATLVSLHGRKNNPVSSVLKNKKVFFLLDKNTDVSRVCEELTFAGLGKLKVIAGENLSYPNEKIRVGNACEFAGREFESLSVMFVLNPEAREVKTVTPGFADENFVRGNVPMTKEEIRALSISKLRLKENDKVYDIGAGTGSVTVEIAMQTRGGRVYAFERNEEGLELIKENAKNFNLQNIKVIGGEASSEMLGAEIPDKAFIGGSGGKLEEMIVNLLKANPNIRVVINAITLETLAKATEILNKYPFENIEILQVNISKNKKLGRYNMLDSQNPIFIISADGNAKE